MIIEDKDNLFVGCKESLLYYVQELQEILMNNNDCHTVLMCLAAMTAMARLDLAETMSAMEDIEGLEGIVSSGLVEGLHKSEAFILAAREGA